MQSMFGVYIRYLVSSLIWSFLNPFGFWQGLVQLFGQGIAVTRGLISKQVRTDLVLSLPFEGYWTIVNGGVTKSTSHSWGIIAQRYAYDFYITDSDGKSHQGDGKRLEDYYAFGKVVLAPADGIVVEVRDGIPDASHPGTGWIDWRTRDFRGNYIIIQHGERAYSFIAHLKQGSFKVKRGDVVHRGQVIGACGNSGHSTEPHIHFQLQDHPNFYLAIGLPARFMNFEMQVVPSGPQERFSEGYISKNHKVGNIAGCEADGKFVEPVSARIGLSDFVTNVVINGLLIVGVIALLMQGLLTALGLW